MTELGLPAFRAKQLASQYYGRLIADPEQMTDLPAALRTQLSESLFPGCSRWPTRSSVMRGDP